MRAARRYDACAETLRAVARCGAARGDRPGCAAVAGAAGKARRRSAAGAKTLGEHPGEFTRGFGGLQAAGDSLRTPCTRTAARGNAGAPGARGIAPAKPERGAKRSSAAALQERFRAAA